MPGCAFVVCSEFSDLLYKTVLVFAKQRNNGFFNFTYQLRCSPVLVTYETFMCLYRVTNLKPRSNKKEIAVLTGHFTEHET